MTIDYWGKERKIAFADCAFYPNAGIYRGNIYNEKREAIGDFWGADSVEIEKHFPNIFGA